MTRSRPPSSAREQLGDRRGVVLTVGVHQDDPLAGRLAQPDLERRRLPQVAAEAHRAHLFVLMREIGRDPAGAVVAAVVDDQDLELQRLGPELLEDLADHRRQVLGLVVRRQDHRDVGAHPRAVIRRVGRSLAERRHERRAYRLAGSTTPEGRRFEADRA